MIVRHFRPQLFDRSASETIRHDRTHIKKVKKVKKVATFYASDTIRHTIRHVTIMSQLCHALP